MRLYKVPPSPLPGYYSLGFPYLAIARRMVFQRFLDSGMRGAQFLYFPKQANDVRDIENRKRRRRLDRDRAEQIPRSGGELSTDRAPFLSLG